MIRSAIRALVRVEIGEPTAGYWTDAQLNTYIDMAAAMFASDTGILMNKPKKANLVAGTSLYSLPGGCPGPQSIQMLYVNGILLDQNTPLGIAQLDGVPHSDTGAPKYWYAVTDNSLAYFALYPIPDTTIANAIVVWFWKLASAMSGDASVCEVPDEYIGGVVAKAAELAWTIKRDSSGMQSQQAKYLAEVMRAGSFVQSMIIAARRSAKDVSAASAKCIF